MYFNLKSALVLFSCLVFSASTLLHAQANKELNKQFMDIMLAFPSGFTSIKGAEPSYSKDGSTFYPKVKITGTEYCMLEKNDITGKLEFKGMIMADDETSYSVFEKAFDEWKKVIANLDFNGATLVPFASDKYAGDDMYAKTAAWRLDAAKYDLDPQYKPFTIWLQLLDLDQGGFMLEILVTDN